MFGWNKLIRKKALIASLRGNRQSLDTTVELFKQQAQDTMQLMKDALRKNDWAAYERVAHDLKNLGRQIAADRLIAHSYELEKLAAERQIEKNADKLEDTERLLGKAIKELTALQRQWKQ